MSKRMVDLQEEGGKITSIDGYEVGGGGGTAVEANPQEEATQQLDKIKIDNITYSTAGGQLYNHHIKILSGMGDRQCCFTYVSSKNIIADSSDNLQSLLGNGNKSISCTGVIKKSDNQFVNIAFLRWNGTALSSEFFLVDKTEIKYGDSGLAFYTDNVEPI